MPRTLFLQAGLIALSTLALFAARPANAQLSFRLDTFDVPGQGPIGSGASGISASGSITGTYVDPSGVNHGYIRSPDGTFTLPIDYPGAANTQILYYNGINNAGYVTGQTLDSSFNYTTDFIYNSNLGTSNPAAFTAPKVTDPMTGLSFGYTNLENVNEAGIVAVQYGYIGDNRIASYNIATDTFTPIADIKDQNGQPRNNELQAIGPNGENLVTLASLTDDTYEGSITQNGMTTYLNVPGAYSTSSDGITTTGLIFGNYEPQAHTPDNRNAYIYDTSNGSYTSIAVPGAVDTELGRTNNATQFVGYYIDANGMYHNLLVTVVPEPGSVALLVGMGVAGAGFLRRRKNRIR